MDNAEAQMHATSAAKRARPSPTPETSSSPSEATATRSTPDHSRNLSTTSASSLEDENDEEDSTSASDSDKSSVLSTSSEDSIEDSSTPILIGGPKKPVLNKQGVLGAQAALRARLATLLPQLEAANAGLVAEAGGLGLEDVDEEGQYIEMDLSLGVLEEKREGEGSDESSEEEEEEEEGEGERERSVMDKLRGQKTKAQKAGIEDVG